MVPPAFLSQAANAQVQRASVLLRAARAVSRGRPDSLHAASHNCSFAC